MSENYNKEFLSSKQFFDPVEINIDIIWANGTKRINITGKNIKMLGEALSPREYIKIADLLKLVKEIIQDFK